MKVLVKEKIADSGVELLRENFDVDLGLEMSDEELREAIGAYDAILVRSATQGDRRADRAGRAAEGDRPRRHRRRQRRHPRRDPPRASSSPTRPNRTRSPLPSTRSRCCWRSAATSRRRTARWSAAPGSARASRAPSSTARRSGCIGFGRIGQLVAKRAQSFEMEVVAFDKFVSAERFRDLGVEGAESVEELSAEPTSITLHVPKTPETIDLIDAEAIAEMKDGVRIVNCARGELVDLDALDAGLESGKVGGAALDVFPSEPFTEHPIFERDDVVVTPHLGASTAEAQDRAGVVTAEQVTAALTGGVVTNAVNIAAVRPEEMEALAPFVPLCEKLGRLAQGLGDGSVDRVTAEFRGRHRRPRHPPARHRRPGRDPLRPHRGAGEPGQRAADGRGARDRADRDARTRSPRTSPSWSRCGSSPAERRVEVGGHRRSGRATSPTWSRSGARASTCRSPTTWPSSATRTGRA